MTFVQRIHWHTDGTTEAGIIVGPFPTEEDARIWMDDDSRSNTVWEIADVHAPW